jgi:N-formylglutamate amidohydrolase
LTRRAGKLNMIMMDFTADLAATGEACDASSPPADDGAAQSFTTVEPLRRIAPLIFSSPHSGRRYPADLRAAAGLMSLRRSEDAYVDDLLSGAPAQGAALITASVARAYVDLNRDPNELDSDMFEERVPHARATPRVQAGLGVIPRIAGDGSPIYRRKLSLAEAEHRFATVHAPYHAALKKMIEATKAVFGCAVLIDCHSMPSCARGPNAPDVVLGDRFGVSCHPSVTALAEAALRRAGYRVARNAPFAGGHTTQTYGRPGHRVHALQIEINRALYLDESTLLPARGLERVRADMTALAEALSAAALHRSLA